MKDARAIVGPRMLIGVSTHNIEQARAAVLDGANYLGAGPTFPSQTKAFDDFAGLDYLREVAAEIRLPTFAIGGIGADNLPEVLATGVTRVAVGAAVTEAREPAVAARELLVMLENAEQIAATAEAVSPSLTPRLLTPRPSTLPCFTQSSWPAAPARDSGRPAATTRPSSCCRWSAARRCSARRSIGSATWCRPSGGLIVTNERLVAAMREQLPELPRGGDRRRALQARHGAVHRAGGAAGQPRRSRRDDGRDAGRPRDPPGREVPGRDSPGGGAGRRSRRGGSSRSASSRRYPAEIFGYIQRGEPIERRGRRSHRRSSSTASAKSRMPRRRESTSTRATTTGTPASSSGRPATILDALAKRQPEMLAHLETIVAAWGTRRARRRVRPRVRGDQGRSRSTTP